MSAGVTQLETIASDQVVDVRGRRRPGPVLALKKSLASSQVGDVLEVLATDPTALAEFPTWSAKTGQEYLGAFEISGDLHLFVRRLA